MNGTDSNRTPVRVLRAFPPNQLFMPEWLTPQRRKWIGAAIAVWLVVFVAIQLMPQTGAIVHMRLKSDGFGTSSRLFAQWYFDRGHGPTSPWYTEAESVVASPPREESDVIFRLPVGVYHALRFDPINGGAKVTVESMQWDVPSGIDKPALALDKLAPTANIDHITRTASGLDIWPTSGNNDPQMQLLLSQPLRLTKSIQPLGDKFLSSLEIAVTLLLLAWLILTRINLQRLVAIGMTLAAGLILAMASINTTVNTRSLMHPDEFFHLEAYRYFVDHSLPPAVDDPTTIPSTSGYGYSYLFELDVVYDIAAHSTAQLRQWMQSDVLSSRMFQFSLWLILCGLAVCHRRWIGVFCVALLSPQIWYVFSYFNADALPLFLSLIVAGLIADQSGGLHRFLQTGDKRNVGLWLAAVCVGLLLISKRNYLPVVPTFMLWLAVVHLGLRARMAAVILGGFLVLGTSVFLGDAISLTHWHTHLELAGSLLVVGSAGYTFWHYWKDAKTRYVLMRLVAFCLLCVVVAIPKIAWDIHVNGWPSQKSERMHAVAEERAVHDFKPSVVAEGKGYPMLRIASRNIPLLNLMLSPYSWIYSSLCSAFGVYGYMNVHAPSESYTILLVLFCAITLLAVFSVRKSEPQKWGGLVTVAAGGCILVFSSSLLLSWTVDFEPQGRYLFPVLPLLGLLIAHGWKHLPRRLFALLLGSAFLVSVCSFAFIALPAFANGG